MAEYRPEFMRRDRELWAEVVKRVRTGVMPPLRYPQPDDADRAVLIEWLEKEVLDESLHAPGGKIMARRLTRSEYLNAIKDLLEVDCKPQVDFPRDDPAWDRLAAAPTLTPALTAQYRALAQGMLDVALARASAAGDDDAGASAAPARMPSLMRREPGATKRASAEAIVTAFARRAYRRPVDAEELDRLMAAFDEADEWAVTFEEALAAPLEEILVSPRFLYRVETRRAGSDPFALASRLALFLWRTGPDDALLDAAEAGTLAKDLPGQVRRMLRDPRSLAMTRDFADSWLSLAELVPSAEINEKLVADMRTETHQFVAHVLRADASVLDFVQADYTFANARLAAHYGLTGVHGDAMRKVSVHGTQRGGLLTHASILALTSRGELSAVQRGKWVLENILGTPPPRPPAGLLDALAKKRDAPPAGTIQEVMAHHRRTPGCADCHARMDAIGFTLESFDAAGAWRTAFNQRPIDPTGVLPDGKVISGVDGLKAYLRDHQDQFARALAAKLLGFALGRKLTDGDRPSLDRIAANTARGEYRSSRLILEVVQSPSFLAGWESVPHATPR
jgi:hypothetical protein